MTSSPPRLEDVSRSRRKTGTIRARTLRQADNDAEAMMWSALKAKRLGGHKFVRQFPIGPYFADFLCRKHRLVVEIDGSQHVTAVRLTVITRSMILFLPPRGAMKLSPSPVLRSDSEAGWEKVGEARMRALCFNGFKGLNMSQAALTRPVGHPLPSCFAVAAQGGRGRMLLPSRLGCELHLQNYFLSLVKLTFCNPQ